VRTWIAAVFVAIAMPAWAQGLTEVKTDNGVRYVQGGVGEEEREAISALRKDFNLELVFAAKGGGNYLADVDVTIRDAKGAEVLRARADAPIMLVQLPAGRYSLEAVYDGKTQKRALSVPARGRQQAGVYFEDISVQEAKGMEAPERASGGASRRR
jgi:hypothetical protein